MKRETFIHLGGSGNPLSKKYTTPEGERGGIVVKIPSSHQCVLGFISRPGIMCALNFLLVPSLLQEVFL